jgi:alcohol dehydrogenase class IV
MVTDYNLSNIPRTFFGVGKIRLLPGMVKSLGSNLVLVTGARSFVSSPEFRKLTKAFEDEAITFRHYRFSQEPSPFLIDGIVNENRGKGAEVVVAIGGGSVIDAGKAISAMLLHESSVMDYVENVGTGKVHDGRKIPFIAVPTTAGTGSECTKNAVLSFRGKGGFKNSLRHDNFIPNIALVDPALSLSCSADITAACGMDAFTQLLESYVSLRANEFTDNLALNGMQHISNSLFKAWEEPSNLDARSSMAYAAWLSGITLANAGLGLVHGFASSIGSKFDIPHGIICGNLLGEVTRANISELRKKSKTGETLKKYTRAGQLFTRKTGKEDLYYIRTLSNKILELTEKLNIPSLRVYGVSAGDISAIVKSTEQKENPVKLSDSVLNDIISRRI